MYTAEATAKSSLVDIMDAGTRERSVTGIYNHTGREKVGKIGNEDITYISNNELYYLLHNSTVDETQETSYTIIIETGDMIDKWELWQLLQLNQRVPFVDYDQFTNSDIKARLEWIMKRD